MGELKLEEEIIQVKKYKNPNDVHDLYYTEELVIGLCGQLGTNLKQVSKELIDILDSEYGYVCEEIKLSDFLFRNKEKPKDEYERIIAGMNYGDSIRKEKSNNVLASLAISKISNSRMSDTTPDDSAIHNFKSQRKCFIINSIKHPDELISFQKVYGTSFYLIGVFSPELERLKNLQASVHKKQYSKIQGLLDRDNDSNEDNGQKLRDVFVNSDYFIRDSNSDNLKNKLNRLIDLIFDYGINTPNIHENSMYQATAAAANSACLSRQVGACLTDKVGNVLSTGWNDVPRFGGGVYISDNNGHNVDQRCFCEDWKMCTNSNKKDNMIENIINDLQEKGIIEKSDSKNKPLYDKVPIVKSILKKNGIKDLIEFGRSVHAEMHAIIVGGQKTGDKMIGGKLYCTTYPCHNCARHIIMAGINEVYYIEPYAKSLCLELHKDAITENESENEKVMILMYEGVAPKSFIKFYQLISDDRKIKIQGQEKNTLRPKHQIHLESLPEKETHYLKSVKDILNIEN